MMYPNAWMGNFQNQSGMPVNNNYCTSQFTANNIMPNNYNNNLYFPNNTNQMQNMLNNIGMPMLNNFFFGGQFQWQLNNMNVKNFAQNNQTNQQNIDSPKVEIQKLPEDSFKLNVLINLLNSKDKSLKLDENKFKNYVKQIMVNLNDKIKTLLVKDSRNDEQNKQLDLLRLKMYKYSMINNFYFPSKYSYMLFDGTSGYFPFSGENHDKGEFRYWNPNISDFITFSKEDMEELEDIKTDSEGKIIKHAQRIKILKDDLTKAKQNKNNNEIKKIEHGFDNCFPMTGNNNIGATCFFDSANIFMLMENPVFFKYLVEFGNRIFKRDEKLNQNGFNNYIWEGSGGKHFINSKYINDNYMFHKFNDKETEELMKSKYNNWSSNEDHQAFHVLVALADYATALVDAQKEDVAIVSPLYLANLMVSICNNTNVFNFLDGTNNICSFMAFDGTGKPVGGTVGNCFKVLFDVMSPTKFAPKFSVNKNNIADLNNYDLSSVARWQTESRLTESFLTNSMLVHNCREYECIKKHKQKIDSEHVTHINVSTAFESSSLEQYNNISFTEVLRAVSVNQYQGINKLLCSKCKLLVDGVENSMYNMFGGSNSIVNFYISNRPKPNKFKFPKLIKAGDGNYWAQISRTSLWGIHWESVTVPYEQLLLFDDFEYCKDTKKNFGVVKEIDLSEASKLDSLDCNLRAWYGYRKISEKNYNLLKMQYEQECQRAGLSTCDHIVDLTGTSFEVASENKLQMNSPLYNFYPAESNRTQGIRTFSQDLMQDIQNPELNKIKVTAQGKDKSKEQRKEVATNKKQDSLKNNNNIIKQNLKNANNVSQDKLNNNSNKIISQNDTENENSQNDTSNNKKSNNDPTNQVMEEITIKNKTSINKKDVVVDLTEDNKENLIPKEQDDNSKTVKSNIIANEKKEAEAASNKDNEKVIDKGSDNNTEHLNLNETQIENNHNKTVKDNDKDIKKINSMTNQNIESNVNQPENKNTLEMDNKKVDKEDKKGNNESSEKSKEEAKNDNDSKVLISSIITDEEKKYGNNNNNNSNNNGGSGIDENLKFNRIKINAQGWNKNENISNNENNMGVINEKNNNNTNGGSNLNEAETKDENNLEMKNSEENIITNITNENENDTNHLKSIKQDSDNNNYNNINNTKREKEEEENTQLELDKQNDNIITNEENETGLISDNNKVEMINENTNGSDNPEQGKEKNDEITEKREEETTEINSDIAEETKENDQNNDTPRKLLMIIGVILLVTAVTLFALKADIWICLFVLASGGSMEVIGLTFDRIKTVLKRFFGLNISYTSEDINHKQASVQNKITEIKNDIQNETNNDKSNNSSEKRFRNEL